MCLTGAHHTLCHCTHAHLKNLSILTVNVQCATGAHVSVCVDNPTALRDLAAEAKQQGTTISVLVEVNAGQDR